MNNSLNNNSAATPKVALIALHGRGATGASVRPLAEDWSLMMGLENDTIHTPQAKGGTWYPNSFMAPFAANAPFLDNSLAQIAALHTAINADGVPDAHIHWLGFSQGACLALEYVSRKGGDFGSVLALSGGLIGPAGTSWPNRFGLANTPIYMGCDAQDPHIPASRFAETLAALQQQGAKLKGDLYPNLGHSLSTEELENARTWIVLGDAL